MLTQRHIFRQIQVSQISGLAPAFCFHLNVIPGITFLTQYMLYGALHFNFDLPSRPCYASVVMATGPWPMGKELFENSTVVEGKIKINDPLLQNKPKLTGLTA